MTELAETADFKGFFSTASNRDWSVTTVRLRLAPPGLGWDFDPKPGPGNKV